VQAFFGKVDSASRRARTADDRQGCRLSLAALGQSVVVSWNTNGEDQPSAVSSNNQLSVYVSGAGRSFSRMMAGGRTTRSEQGSIGNAASTAVSVFRKRSAAGGCQNDQQRAARCNHL